MCNVGSMRDETMHDLLFFQGLIILVNILLLHCYRLREIILQQEKYGINQHYQHHTPPNIPPSTNSTTTTTTTTTIIILIRPGLRRPHIRLKRL